MFRWNCLKNKIPAAVFQFLNPINRKKYKWQPYKNELPLIIHCRDCVVSTRSLRFVMKETIDCRVFPAVFYKHSLNKYRFCYRAFRRAEGLEGLSGFRRKAVQIQAVVPVCPSAWKMAAAMWKRRIRKIKRLPYTGSGFGKRPRKFDQVIFIGGLNHEHDCEGNDREDMVLLYGQDRLIKEL